MELFYFPDKHGNFGDDLNQWIWDGLLPGWREAAPDHVLVGVGTLINDVMPRGRTKIIAGSGVGYGALPAPDLMAECRFFSVRGPHSAARLGLPPEKGIADPAIMLPEFPEFQGIAKSGPPIFVPHHTSIWRHDWNRICARGGIDFVSPQGEAHEVIRRIAAAPFVLAESMHAAIIADAFGTPWQTVVFSDKFLASKWLDWGDSLGLTIEFPDALPMLDRLRRSSRSGPATTKHDTKTLTFAPTSAAPQRSVKARLRGLARVSALRLERVLLPARMRALCEGPGQLSDRGRLADAQNRYRAMLAELSAELGLPSRPIS